MSMRPSGSDEVPAETMRVARAAFPKGSLAIRMRDELGFLFSDEQFAGLFPARGKRAWSPGRLAMVLVLQFVEGLADRQAAEAVRARIDWKFALGLELTDPGFDFSVLSEFRDRLVSVDAGRGVLDAILAAARDRGLVTSGGKARTDSTHVLSSARELNWLEQVGETLRTALNAVAQAEPAWATAHALPDGFKHYATRIEDSRFPKTQAKRVERDLLPDGHGVDIGYTSSGALVAARREHRVELHGPMQSVTVPHARPGATHGQDAFTIGWDNQQMTCPTGVTSTQGHQRRPEDGLPTIRVRFSPADCRTCPQLRACVNSPRAQRREINLRPRDEYEALQQARTLQDTDDWKARYKIRAGVEGTISPAVQACGLRSSRYRGLAKTSLQHQLTGAAVNLIRINAWLTDQPHARTRTSPLTALRPAA